MKKELRKHTNTILVPEHSCRFLFRWVEYRVPKSKVRYPELLSPCRDTGRVMWSLCREGSYVRKERGRKVLETMCWPGETERMNGDMLLGETTLSNTGRCQRSLRARANAAYVKARMSDAVTDESKQGDHAALLPCPTAHLRFPALLFPSSILLWHTLLLQPSGFISGRRTSALCAALHKNRVSNHLYLRFLLRVLVTCPNKQKTWLSIVVLKILCMCSIPYIGQRI